MMLYELLVACESRLLSADGNTVTQEASNGIACTVRTEDGSRPESTTQGAGGAAATRPLLELCGLVEARVIDLDGVYDPCRPNDRLLLGMNGSISEFELGIIRPRMYEAARSKARRGGLRISGPIGSAWERSVGLGLDPDRRLQEVIRLVFQKFRELGSARQALLWMASQNIHFPYPSNGRTLTSIEWRPIRYRNVISILKNPFYAGVYAYGKSEKRTTIVDGRARKSYGHRKPMGTWEVFIKDHHESYISWEEYERNQALLAGNAYGSVRDTKSGRGGRALGRSHLLCALRSSAQRSLHRSLSTAD